MTIKFEKIKLDELVLTPAVAVLSKVRVNQTDYETQITFGFLHKALCVTITRAIKPKAIKA